jgi:hypothetical protein
MAGQTGDELLTDDAGGAEDADFNGSGHEGRMGKV